MTERNEENLKELFERFLGGEQADEAAEEVQKAEQILAQYPAPEPDEMLIAEIKREIADALPYKKTTAFKQVVYKTMSVAAVFILLTVVSVMLFNQRTDKIAGDLMMSVAIWESEDISVDDANLSTLLAEVEQIEGEMLALELDGNGSNGGSAVMEMELELIEIDSDFWKG
ncbi:MAG: hypothetical protein ACYS1A_10790 [Planctomycetota bacterium]|jgi:hypothetical protein